MLDMSYERFCFLNQDNKINNYLNRKVTIGNVLDKDNIEIFVYKKENKNCKLLGTKIVSINDILSDIISSNSYYISNPSSLRKFFNKNTSTILNSAFIDSISFNDRKELIFYRNTESIKRKIGKLVLSGQLKFTKTLNDAIAYNDKVYVVSEKKVKCVDASHLFEDCNFTTITLKNIDFCECNLLCKMFAYCYIDNLEIDFDKFSSNYNLNYMFLHGTIKNLTLKNLDFTKILDCDHMFFDSNIEILKLYNIVLPQEIESIVKILAQKTKGPYTLITDNVILLKELKSFDKFFKNIKFERMH